MKLSCARLATPAGMESMLLTRRLIELKMPLIVIRRLSPFSQHILREWWREIHGNARPPSGKIYETMAGPIQTLIQACHASLLCALHETVTQSDGSLELKSFLCAYEAYLAYPVGPEEKFSTKETHMDVAAAYVVLRDLYSCREAKRTGKQKLGGGNIVELRRCPSCRQHHLFVNFTNVRVTKYLSECCWCALSPNGASWPRKRSGG